MTELDVLRDHGPAPTPLAADALDRARACLEREIERRPAPMASVVGFRPRRRARSRRLALGLAAAGLAAVATITPSFVGSLGSQAIALGPAQPLSFPYTPGFVPAGLGNPIFEKDLNFAMAQYRGKGADKISIIAPDSVNFWSIPQRVQHVDVQGHDALLFTTSRSRRAVVWSEAGGEVVGVVGSGEYAEPDVIESVAGSLSERPQPVHLVLTVAPRGWTATAYKADRIVEYTGPGSDSLMVSILDRFPTDLTGYAASDVTDVQVSGSPAMVGRTAAGWIFVGRASDGTPFSLQAPTDLTRRQVLAIANGVQHRS